MIRRFAFLRGINVGGKGIVSMSDLRTAFEAAGCASVRTYIQSGNVVFDAPKAGFPKLANLIAQSIAPLVPPQCAVAYRSIDEMRSLVAAQPFAHINDPEVKVYVAFLAEDPEHESTFPLESSKDGLTATALRGRDLLVESRPVKGRYGYPNLWIEKTLGAPATTRNWTTVEKILRFAE